MAQKPCTHCGKVKDLVDFGRQERMTDGHRNQCRDCTNAQRREWRAANSNREKQARNTHYKRNAKKLNAQCRESYQRHIEARQEYGRQWYKLNPEKARKTWRRQNMLKRYRNQRVFACDAVALKQYYELAPEGFEVDHIVPLNGHIEGRPVSGLHVSWNFQYLTRTANASKHKAGYEGTEVAPTRANGRLETFEDMLIGKL